MSDDVWKEAVLDQCAVAHSSFYEDDPKKTLDTLIDWHVQVALDPQVSSAAQALVDSGKAQGQGEPIAEVEFDNIGWRHMVDAILCLPAGTKLYTSAPAINEPVGVVVVHNGQKVGMLGNQDIEAGTMLYGDNG